MFVCCKYHGVLPPFCIATVLPAVPECCEGSDGTSFGKGVIIMEHLIVHLLCAFVVLLALCCPETCILGPVDFPCVQTVAL